MSHNMMHRFSKIFRLTGFILVGMASSPRADQPVFSPAPPESLTGAQRLVNPGFEEGGPEATPAWSGWMSGFERMPGAGRTGGVAVHCASGDASGQYGASQSLTLNQDRPRIIEISGWSKAERVDGTPDTGYAIYLDVTFADGSHLWGHAASFSIGAHDWEYRRTLLAPEKPIAQLTVHALFRGHTGQVWFDDFSLTEFPETVNLFENVPVGEYRATPQYPPATPHFVVEDPQTNLLLRVNATPNAETRLTTNGVTLGDGGIPLFVRDAGAQSPFLAPDAWQVTTGENGLIHAVGELPALGIQLTADYAWEKGSVTMHAQVEDKKGIDRALTVYAAFPIIRDGCHWQDDPRHDRPVNGMMSNTVRTGAGATGTMSRYPLASLITPAGGLSLAMPIDDPRHGRLFYDTVHQLFVAAIDLGLSPAAAKSPCKAGFRLHIYAMDAGWGFRSALEKYYALYPEAFARRVPCEGLWMAFTDISGVKGWEDFGFAFHEGSNNIPWDEQHDILTFEYTEPMTTWIPLPPEIERSHTGAMKHLDTLLAEPDPAKRAPASIIRASCVRDPQDQFLLGVFNAPWCDGCVFALNADPNIPTSAEDPKNRGQAEIERLEAAVMGHAPRHLPDWLPYGEGCELDTESVAEGRQSVRLTQSTPGGQHGLSQTIDLNQTAPAPLYLKASVRTENLTGAPDTDCSLYVDLLHADGTPLYSQTIPLEPGTHPFQTIERTISSEKPFQRATVHLLFRGAHTGTVWFDNIYLAEKPDGGNRLRDPGLESPPEAGAAIDGVYIDSYEFWANSLNYDRRQFAGADLPLCYDANTQQCGILTVFSTFEFQREMALRIQPKGKFMMANGVLATYPFPVAYLDVLGTETNWFPNGQWTPLCDEELLYRRALCAQKPYCFLMNTHYASLSLDDLEKYLRRAVFYGMYPGFFSENAATACFFDNPDWYEAARPLFKKYLPVCRTIAQAGWQPVTGAGPLDQRLHVERFGDAQKGEIYLTVLNETQEPVATRISLLRPVLAWPREAVLTAQEMLTGMEMPLDSSDCIPVDIPPGTLMAIHVSTAHTAIPPKESLPLK